MLKNAITSFVVLVFLMLVIFSVRIGIDQLYLGSTARPYKLENVVSVTPEQSILFGHGIDINRSPVSHLVILPGIGLKLAEEIVRFRRENGGFSSIDDLLKVKGIGPAKLAKIRRLTRL